MGQLPLAILCLAVLLPGMMTMDKVFVAADRRLLLIVEFLTLGDLRIALHAGRAISSAVGVNLTEDNLPGAVGDVIE